jgi:hypothetical protein
MILFIKHWAREGYRLSCDRRQKQAAHGTAEIVRDSHVKWTRVFSLDRQLDHGFQGGRPGNHMGVIAPSFIMASTAQDG